MLLVGAGPAGLELAGEIMHFFPDKQVTIVDVAPDILAGPYDQELRDELRRQLDKIGVTLLLGSPLRELPATPAATAGPVAVTTAAGDEVTADIWFRCFGVAPATDFVPVALLDETGRVRVDEWLRVRASMACTRSATPPTPTGPPPARPAARPTWWRRACGPAITGEGDEGTYEAPPVGSLVPLGPEAGAGQLPGAGVVGPEKASAIKGRTMLLDLYEVLFDAPVRR